MGLFRWNEVNCDSILQFASMASLIINYNILTDDVPHTLGNSQKLASVELSSNQLTFYVPEAYSLICR
ncbi:hypothetical protein C5167_023332 [Papaver somniferum]|uniref:Leucine-rich repeat-containing N-terminal plant-type domain-containing protein n=1 Tax=Papaver somniferum TaxID=3469 RepID=A0A4Y7JKE5_PAPSO|nr:hypothetical protein C5167_023332 [Papaver somniferum]